MCFFSVFGDFAPPRVSTFAELGRTAIPFPSWLQKIGRAFSQESDEAKRQFANTTIDVYKAMLYAGLAIIVTLKQHKYH